MVLAQRIYVRVLVEFNEQGQMVPKLIYWQDGRRFSIDRVLDIRRAAALKAGGSGIRYTCRVQGREIYLFEDNNKWFVEAV